VKPFRGRTWELCLNDDCPDMIEMRRQKAERQAARDAREAAKANAGAEEAGSDDEDADGAEPRRGAPRKKPSPGTARVRKAGSRPKSKTKKT
jgi:hypothetical protein